MNKFKFYKYPVLPYNIGYELQVSDTSYYRLLYQGIIVHTVYPGQYFGTEEITREEFIKAFTLFQAKNGYPDLYVEIATLLDITGEELVKINDAHIAETADLSDTAQVVRKYETLKEIASMDTLEICQQIEHSLAQGRNNEEIVLICDILINQFLGNLGMIRAALEQNLHSNLK